MGSSHEKLTGLWAMKISMGISLYMIHEWKIFMGTFMGFS